MKTVVVGTAGHIDHGKSALVQALTGIDPDRLKEEKARGITHRPRLRPLRPRATCTSPSSTCRATSGSCGTCSRAPAASTRCCWSWRPTNRSCRRRASTSTSAACSASRAASSPSRSGTCGRRHAAAGAAGGRELVEGTVLASAPMVRVSSRTGDGLDALRRRLRGPRAAAAPRAGRRRPRACPSIGCSRCKGFGTVVTGTLVSGRIREDDELLLVPGPPASRCAACRCTALRTTRAAGQRVAVNLGGVEVGQVARGQSLVTPQRLRAARAWSTRTWSCSPSARPLQAWRAGALPPGHGGAARPRRRCRAANRADGRAARRIVLRPDPPRGASRPDARRSLHPARVLAARSPLAAASCSTRTRPR